MSKIADKVSDIFGFRVREGEWEKYLPDMDREGEPTRKHMAELIFAVCQDLESLHKELEELKLKEVSNAPRTTKRRNTN